MTMVMTMVMMMTTTTTNSPRSVISSYLLGGGIPYPPESQIPPEKHTKYKKTLKNASNLHPTPQICVFPYQNLESRINTAPPAWHTSHVGVRY